MAQTVGIPMIVVQVALAALALIFPALWHWAAVLFSPGWLLQFIGHAIEGKPPEFLSNGDFCGSAHGGGGKKVTRQI